MQKKDLLQGVYFLKHGQLKLTVALLIYSP